jgi:hypothetical protein
MRRNDLSTAPSAPSPIDDRVLHEMDQLGLEVVKIRLATALQKGSEWVPVQRPGVLGAAPTCTQVVGWVSLKEAEKERKERRRQIATLIFAVIGALAAVSSALIPPDVLHSAVLQLFRGLFLGRSGWGGYRSKQAGRRQESRLN